jgi:bifunctional non-homologous end joining protein LigD
VPPSPEQGNGTTTKNSADSSTTQNIAHGLGVIPKFIPTFEVALAHDAAKVKGVDIFDGTWFVSRKLDGVRCICFIHGDEVRFFSRNGKEFLTLGKVAEEIKRLGITDTVLDGEICQRNKTFR